MAQYKVPQDVEADDKLLGPFNFRQFIYLLIAGGLGFLGFGLSRIFPLLAFIPAPFILFLLVLALPLKKDQPMETYLAAIISFYTKPHKRFWNPGQRESTILITAPKKVEENRIRNISGSEASHRLSFLANIVDSEGHSIKNAIDSPMREDFITEANSATDMFDNYAAPHLDKIIATEADNRHNELVAKMRAAFEEEKAAAEAVTTKPRLVTKDLKAPIEQSSAIVQPIKQPPIEPPKPKPQPQSPKPSKPTPKPAHKPKNNSNEVFISLR